MKILEKKLNGDFSSHTMFVMIADIQLKETTDNLAKKRYMVDL